MSGDVNACPLLDLPAELRERILSFCVDETAQSGGDHPKEPPITFVSRRLRSESLPLYYARYTLAIKTYVKCDFYSHVWLTTRKWYYALPYRKLRHVEQFRCRFILVQQYTGELVPIEFQISLLRRSGGYELSHSFDRAWIRNPHRTGDPADFEEVLQALKTHLRNTLDRLVEYPGVGNWMAEDIDQLTKIDPDILPLQTEK